jgi:hypothetical protein
VDDVVADLLLPKLLAVLQIQRGGVCCTAADKVDVNPLTITCRSRRGVGCLAVGFREPATVNFRRPLEFTCFAIETNDRLHFRCFIGRLQDDVVTDNDGGTMAATGNGRDPLDRLGGAEFYRWHLISVRFGNAIPIRPAPPRPILG